ncbi:protein translocase subunit SecF [Candidatus Pacebacteria bacterium]|nr:protein translocase subunit SecF [Candidatus Paceibacterota bacterium]
MFAIIYKKIFLYIALGLVLGSIALVAGLGLPLGIDFTGGSLTEVSYEERPAKESVESTLDTLDLGGYSLRESIGESGHNGYILRTRDLTESERITVDQIMTSIGAEGGITRFTSIGPVIGEELKDKSVWAIGGVILVIVLYVAFAFRGVSKPVGSWIYGGITVLVLMHDVLVPAALMSVLGYLFGAEVDVLFVTAILAVLGYSVNDTIVVFDRVRENLIKYRQEKKKNVNMGGGVTRVEVTYTYIKPFGEIVGLAVSETLARSINTSLTTFVALTALFFFGGGHHKNIRFSFDGGSCCRNIFFNLYCESTTCVNRRMERNKGQITHI